MEFGATMAYTDGRGCRSKITLTTHTARPSFMMVTISAGIRIITVTLMDIATAMMMVSATGFGLVMMPQTDTELQAITITPVSAWFTTITSDTAIS